MKCSIIHCSHRAVNFYRFGEDVLFGYCKRHTKVPEKQIMLIERTNTFQKKKRIRMDKMKKLLRSEDEIKDLSNA